MSLVTVNLDIDLIGSARELVKVSKAGALAIKSMKAKVENMTILEWIRNAAREDAIIVWALEYQGIPDAIWKQLAGGVEEDSLSAAGVLSALYDVQLAYMMGVATFPGTAKRRAHLGNVIAAVHQAPANLTYEEVFPSGSIDDLGYLDLESTIPKGQWITYDGDFNSKHTVNGRFSYSDGKFAIKLSGGCAVRYHAGSLQVYCRDDDFEKLIGPRTQWRTPNQDLLEAAAIRCASSKVEWDAFIRARYITVNVMAVAPEDDLDNVFSPISGQEWAFFYRELHWSVTEAERAIRSSAMFDCSLTQRVTMSRADRDADILRKRLVPVGPGNVLKSRRHELSEADDERHVIGYSVRGLLNRIISGIGEDGPARLMRVLVGTLQRSQKCTRLEAAEVRLISAMRTLLGCSAPQVYSKYFSKRKVSYHIDTEGESFIYVPSSNVLYMSCNAMNGEDLVADPIPGEGIVASKPELVDSILLSHIVPSGGGVKLDDSGTDLLLKELRTDFRNAIRSWRSLAKARILPLWKDYTGRIQFSSAFEVIFNGCSNRHVAERAFMMWLNRLGAIPHKDSTHACLVRLMRAERKSPSSGFFVVYDKGLSTQGLDMYTEVTPDREYWRGDGIVCDPVSDKCYKLAETARGPGWKACDIVFKDVRSALRLEGNRLDRSDVLIGGQ
ncbi:unnamed protein product [Chondrus crispus]|uniref:Uncharacterized protein n=1 Tax=Chondrus crispus TaxID=2769 RepID=R7Q7K3_CHOCR|nr:unnamed protein product [Chondrus crispus]CDF33371.1 unnamed protein product [Chondrus crispus]|eukprot:XP_005713174.1 unnamed protein product [Chondrus crispus]